MVTESVEWGDEMGGPFSNPLICSDCHLHCKFPEGGPVASGGLT